MNRFTAQQVWQIVADPKMIMSTCGSDDDLGMSDDATRSYTGVRVKRAPLFWGPHSPIPLVLLGPRIPIQLAISGRGGTVTLAIMGCSSDLGTFRQYYRSSCQYYRSIEYYYNLLTEHIVVGKQVEH